MRNWLVNTDPYEPQDYKGATVCAHPDLHARVIEILTKYLPPGTHVLDVGAGAGALSLRLLDAGYRVEALDVESSLWQVEELSLRVGDLNEGLTASIEKQYDGVCCCEVIEHVENPWSLMRDIYTVLKPGGVALVSTPHVTHFESRLMFLATGHLRGFSAHSAASMGHINPIQPYEMRQIISSVGYELLEEALVGRIPIFDFEGTRNLFRLPLMLAYNIARGCAYVISRGEKKQGWCMAFLARRPET